MKSLFSICGSVLLMILLTGCDSWNYSRPQPVDAPDELVFPQSCRGDWLDEDSLPVQVGADHVQIVMAEEEKVIRGFPDHSRSIDVMSYPHYYEVNHDPSGRPSDTIVRYVEHGGLIFHISDEGLLEKGFRYRNDHDTILIEKRDTMEFRLGYNARLRKISDGLYAISTMNEETEQRGWWSLTLFSTREPGIIRLYSETDRLKELPDMIRLPDSAAHERLHYVDPYWTRQDIRRLLEAGYYKPSGVLKKKDGNAH